MRGKSEKVTRYPTSYTRKALAFPNENVPSQRICGGHIVGSVVSDDVIVYNLDRFYGVGKTENVAFRKWDRSERMHVNF